MKKKRLKGLALWLKPNYIGLMIGLVFYCFALTPSLMPMPPVFAGVVTGISFAFGYGVGVIISWMARKLNRKRTELPNKVKKIAWIVLLTALPILVITYGLWASSWQNEVRELLDLPKHQSYQTITIVFVAALVALIVTSLARAIAWLARRLGNATGRWVPPSVGTVIGIVATIALLVIIYNGVLSNAFVTVSNNIYRSANNRTDVGAVRPQSTLRSGGPESLVGWETLGRQGRNFTSSGPSLQEINQVSGQAAKEPIRVYVGLQSAETIEERANLALEELKRTKAFERKVLAIITVTGTGWVQPQSADSLEYIWGGDSAIASIQYSYLPSWISTLVNQQDAADAGRALFNTVYDYWDTLPVNERPKLLVHGLSLGSYGGQAAFSGEQDMQNRSDGALFLGSPSFSQPWDYFTRQRDPGSPQWQPVYDEGRVVRFASLAQDFYNIDTPWEYPRIAYLQHASDPVVWWSPDLILREPDWLKEPRGPDVTPDMQWYPFVTFIQVSINQFFALKVPDGHGHNYANDIVEAWTALVAPADWNQERGRAIQQIIDEYTAEKSQLSS